jgi:hypothetical protein
LALSSNKESQRKKPQKQGIYSNFISHKGVFMKNTIKWFGIIALVAIIGFSMAGCDNGNNNGNNKTDVPVTGVTLDKTTLSLNVGDTETLTATVAPDNATNKEVTWATSDEEKVTVENGVVTALAEGTATITVTTADGNITDTCPVTITAVSVGTAPTITTATLPNGRVGTAYNRTVTATGERPITWSVESGTLPTGLSLAETTGVISGTPTTAATSTFTVKAANAMGSGTKQLSITITRAGGGGGGTTPTIRALTITTASLPNGTVETAYSQTVTATGTTPITWSIDSGSLPAGLNIASATGVISGTPTTAGTSPFTVKATNAAGNATKLFSIVIDIPTFTSIAEFKTWLDAQPANTAATAYKVKLNVSDLAGNSDTPGSAGYALRSWGKCVSLDLSGSTITYIEDDAFYSCHYLTSVTIPNSVTSIGYRAFFYYPRLTSVTIPNIRETTRFT